MTKLLEEIVAQLENLPEDVQEQFSRQLSNLAAERDEN